MMHVLGPKSSYDVQCDPYVLQMDLIHTHTHTTNKHYAFAQFSNMGVSFYSPFFLMKHDLIGLIFKSFHMSIKYSFWQH